MKKYIFLAFLIILSGLPGCANHTNLNKPQTDEQVQITSDTGASTGAKSAAATVPLTAEELESYNKAFSCNNPISQFLTSYYSRPQDINLVKLLWYYPSDGLVTDKAEFEALKTTKNWHFSTDATLDSIPVPIHKYSVGTVNKALIKYTGISLDDLSGVGMDKILYSKAYNAYYTYTSDMGNASFVCICGVKQGAIIRLYSETAMLVLIQRDDGFWIMSHQPIGEASAINGGPVSTPSP